MGIRAHSVLSGVAAGAASASLVAGATALLIHSLSVPEGKSQDGAVIAHTRPASDLSVSSAIPHKAASASASASGPATVNAHLPASSSGETEITEGHVFVHVHHRPHGKPAAIPHCKAESSSADEPATTIPAIITRNQVEVGGVKLVYDPKAKSVGVTSQMEGLGDRSVSVDADMTKWYRTGARIDHLRRVVQKQREEE